MEDLRKILRKLKQGEVNVKDTEKEVLDLFLVVLSDAKGELYTQKRKFTENDYYFVGDEDSFENGFSTSIDLIKEELNHSS